MTITGERQYVSRRVPNNSTLLTSLLIAVAVANSATLGYDSSVMNGLLILPSYTEYFQLTAATIGLNNAAMWLGGILGVLLMQPVPDRIALQASAQNIAMFVIARLIIGVGTALSNIAAPLLLGELMPPHRRGRILGLFFSCFYVGSLLSSVINLGSQNISSTWAWRLPSMLQIIPSLLSMLLLPFVPESPRWLIAKGQDEHAKEVLLLMQPEKNSVSATIGGLVHEIRAIMAKEEEEMPGNPWKELVSTPGND